MTHLNRIIIALALTFLMVINGLSSSAKSYAPDTIRLQMPNATTIEYRTSYGDKSELLEINDVKTELERFLKRWEVLSIKDLNPDKSVIIRCKTDKQYMKETQLTMSIEEKPSQKKIVFPLDKAVALMVNGKNTLELNPNLLIHFDRFEQLKELADYDYATLLPKIDEVVLGGDTPRNNDCSRFCSWINVEGEGDISELDFQRHGSAADQIIITGGPSLSNIKGDWNGGFFASMIVQLGKKGLSRQAFKLEYEWMYDFSSGKENINHWMDFGYSYNASSNPEKNNWYGASFGYLVKRNGTTFDKDQMRIGLAKRLNNHVVIVPEVYFTGFLKDAYPAIKLKINF
ncbi:hypothetical protein EYV94_22725 [Puteibacter caeruleilacunae]|nr:hypothetical protein EYV94_22725 [Puteibacter caeruleilacunae]